jgi:carbamoyl-phosphate synthase small subunit
MVTKAYLRLEDGEVIEGKHFGYEGPVCGEVVFSTGMTGYTQSLTDPSFAGQILVFTYPLVGNYGVPKPLMQDSHLVANSESERIWTSGVVVSSVIYTPSHYQSETIFSDWLTSQKIPGISHIDTRALTQKIREKGVMRGRITLEKDIPWDGFVLKNLVAKTSLPKVVTYTPKKPCGKRILLIDCGVKHGIIRELLSNGYEVIRIPWDKDPMEYASRIDGVVVSNGPGDPKDCQITIDHIRKVIDAGIPYIGVCLGHQLAALAIGADTYKLPYGHRGINQPCQDVISGKAYITSQNHGYAVKADTIPKGYKQWFINLNDKTNEGLQGIEKKVWTTQFHPEGQPGPFDTKWIFSLFKK